jgi:hypothetical protein
MMKKNKWCVHAKQAIKEKNYNFYGTNVNLGGAIGKQDGVCNSNMGM